MKTLFGYENAVQHVLSNGRRFAGTRACLNVDIVIDLPDADEQIVWYPKYRGVKKTSHRYFLNESRWYMMATRDPQFIIDCGGKIWDTMRDENGLVNSNYGYQVKKHHDLDVLAGILVQNREVDAWIVDSTNAKLKHDTVCNNVVKIREDDESLRVEVWTRSLDLTFGLPYDLAAAQSLAYLIAAQAGIGKTVSSVTFHVVNCHIYKRDIETFDSFTEPFALEGVRFEETPYVGYDGPVDLVNATLTESLPIDVSVDGHISEYHDISSDKFSNIISDLTDEINSDVIRLEISRMLEEYLTDYETRKAMSVIGKKQRVVIWYQAGVWYHSPVFIS
jgi:thymidylate synthase